MTFSHKLCFLHLLLQQRCFGSIAPLFLLSCTYQRYYFAPLQLLKNTISLYVSHYLPTDTWGHIFWNLCNTKPQTGLIQSQLNVETVLHVCSNDKSSRKHFQCNLCSYEACLATNTPKIKIYWDKIYSCFSEPSYITWTNYILSEFCF